MAYNFSQKLGMLKNCGLGNEQIDRHNSVSAFLFIPYKIHRENFVIEYTNKLNSVFSSCSLRSHPRFKKIVANRLQHDDLHALGKVLSDLSIGRQP